MLNRAKPKNAPRNQLTNENSTHNERRVHWRERGGDCKLSCFLALSHPHSSSRIAWPGVPETACLHEQFSFLCPFSLRCCCNSPCEMQLQSCKLCFLLNACLVIGLCFCIGGLSHAFFPPPPFRHPSKTKSNLDRFSSIEFLNNKNASVPFARFSLCSVSSLVSLQKIVSSGTTLPSRSPLRAWKSHVLKRKKNNLPSYS